MPDIVFLDFETTGSGTLRTDEVLEVGIIDEAGNVLVDTLVRPAWRQTWDTTQKIHGISPDNVVDAPTMEQVTPYLIKALEGRRVIIFNAPFDVRFMPDEVQQAAHSYVCLMQLFRKVHNGRYRLVDALKWSNYPYEQNHRALDDTFASLHIWNHIRAHSANKFPALVKAAIYEKKQ